EMWEDYKYEYQLRAKVISITNVQNTLEEEKRYRLVVIDESHNLRNKEGKRYSIVKDYLERNESKVILLTATPYNKSYMDLSSQLSLFIPENHNLGISPDKYIQEIGGITKFSASHQVNENTISAFDKSPYSEDWQQLMALYLVRRTRNFIKEHYTYPDEATGKRYLKFSDGSRQYFPERKPKKVEYKFDSSDETDQYAKLYTDEIVNLINSLKLPRYGLGQDIYVNNEPGFIPTKDDNLIQQNLGRAGARLKGFARTNLFKRLESSGYSFLLSISRHLLRNYLFMYAYENKLPFPIGKQESGTVNDLIFIDYDSNSLPGVKKEKDFKLLFDKKEYIERAKKYYEAVSNQRNKFEWINSMLFSKKLYDHLKDDSKSLFKILNEGKDWTPDDDRQLTALINLCTKKHKNDKVLIFTQFADTAHYLERQFIAKKILKTACVTGDDENPTAFAHRFSPVSNHKEEQISEDNEIRVLIATDVLSEGQNLQDCHIILNYDLPWAIIRLIQRAGRVDRIGQKADEILCYSFLPEEGIEKIIKLRDRLQNRIRENAETIGSDEVFFDGDPINLKDLYNEKSGVFDDGEETDIDLGSYAYEIWRNAIEKNPQLEKIIPNLPDVVYSTKKTDPKHKKGVLIYTRTSHENDILAYMDTKGDILTKSQTEILKLARCDQDEPAIKRLKEHHEIVKSGVESIKKIESRIGGQLGQRNGSRYRTYERLKFYIDDNPNSLFVTDSLVKATEEIYKYPLRDRAKDILNREFKNHIRDEDFIDIVVNLREDGKLCNIPEDGEIKRKEPKIICSMGLVN
ncbi:MAG: DEAD/DEAH box helicase, partial [Candidatus Delongbacteria bacterium]|nr:DEAD/DEAH box helicase [Candidatus Delongbacteria bacterium]